MKLLLFWPTKIGESTFLLAIFNFFYSFSCFEKRLKVYLYGQIVLSNDAANDLATLCDGRDFHSISRIVVGLLLNYIYCAFYFSHLINVIAVIYSVCSRYLAPHSLRTINMLLFEFFLVNIDETIKIANYKRNVLFST